MNSPLLDELRQRITAQELDAHAEAIMASARIAVALEIGEKSSGASGESRFGGAPDLPLSIAWPRDENGGALAFLAQINLAEIGELEENPLPPRGMFYVFLGLDEPATDVLHRIFIYEGDEPLETVIAPDQSEFIDDVYLDLPPHRLILRPRAEAPRWSTNDYEALSLEMDEDEQNALEMLVPRSPNEIGQLLGHARGIGHDPREDAFVVRECDPVWLYDYPRRAKLDLSGANHWLSLLQLHSMEAVGFGVWDAGYLQFLISHDDLRALNFSRVYAHVESS